MDDLQSLITSRSPDGSAGLQLRAVSSVRWDLVSFGEVMLRFDPGEERIAQARTFRVWEGGGEYNVARGLHRCFGKRTSVVTALADNSVGRLIEGLMREGGVDLSHVRWVPYDGIGRASRNGVYFLERGHGIRAAQGVMDRGHTPLSQMHAGEVDWNALFAEEGARWFHSGGILCALSPESPAMVRESLEAAQSNGVVVSFDCNYRPSLWKNQGGRSRAIAVNRTMMPFVDVLFGHEGDLAELAGDAAGRPPWHTAESFAAMCRRILDAFPNLKVIATTLRNVTSASRNDWGAFAWAEGRSYESIVFRELDILDRVGGGDSFAAGVIDGLLDGRGMQWALDCGVAHGALAMSTPGDSSMATRAEVEGLMKGASAAVQR